MEDLAGPHPAAYSRNIALGRAVCASSDPPPLDDRARTDSPSRHAILVVDDEQHVCELLSDILEAESFEPVCVQRDDEAFAVLRGGQDFTCMIVDVNLGRGVTGFDVARFGRTIEPGLPVVFVSGETSGALVEANGVPAAKFVEKPFTVAQLATELHALVGENGAS
ncbi:response regulator [Phenylobacterium sp. J426]|uniref:response regulator n=1 Tax=Phenylobacterium sp. J426 TaxID=2898439 RepID=UPI0021507F05|nr:response regulator [Phenylobacterium sp. J426]MCR5876873.1 response regulator [Phenylobacterium sp. J426]